MIKIKKVEGSRVIFNNGWKLFHIQHDCNWSDNYPDFQGCIKDSILENMEFSFIEIEPTEYGFLFNGYLINCYSEQSGCYTRDLDIYLIDENNIVLQRITVEGKLVLLD